MSRMIVGILGVCIAGVVLAAQVPQSRDAVRQPSLAARTGTSSISGVVVSDDTDPKPIRRVTVTVTTDSSPSGGRVAITDDSGRFVVPGLPAGRYLVTANKPAYLTTAYGATRQARPGPPPTGTAIVLADGQIMDVRMRLARGAVVTGTVRDEAGKPVREADVTLFYYRRSLQTGERTLTAMRTDAVPTTNAQGVYRIYGVPPGDYLVSVTVGSQMLVVLNNSVFSGAVDLEVPPEDDFVKALAPGKPELVPTPRRRVGFARSYFPGALNAAAATTITLAAGQERAGIDVSLQRVPNSRVEGTLTSVDGTPARSSQVRLFANVDEASPGASVGSTGTDGRFSIVGVAPGAYTLVAIGPTQTWATAEVTTNGDDQMLALQLQPPLTVSGRITIDGAAPSVAPRARLQLMPLRTPLRATGTLALPVSPTGTFSAMLPPGRYRLVATWPAGGGQPEHAVVSARVGSHDVVDQDIEVTESVTDMDVAFSSRVSQLSGMMSDATGQPAPEYFIIVFPKDEAMWNWHARRIQQTRPTHDGRFVIRGLPAGDYLLSAVTDVDQAEWFDAAFLKSLVPASIPLTLADGEVKTQDIRVR
jgi:hypothetical protein